MPEVQASAVGAVGALSSLEVHESDLGLQYMPEFQVSAVGPFSLEVQASAIGAQSMPESMPEVQPSAVGPLSSLEFQASAIGAQSMPEVQVSASMLEVQPSAVGPLSSLEFQASAIGAQSMPELQVSASGPQSLLEGQASASGPQGPQGSHDDTPHLDKDYKHCLLEVLLPQVFSSNSSVIGGLLANTETPHLRGSRISMALLAHRRGATTVLLVVYLMAHVDRSAAMPPLPLPQYAQGGAAAAAAAAAPAPGSLPPPGWVPPPGYHPPTCYAKVLSMAREIAQRAARQKRDPETNGCVMSKMRSYISMVEELRNRRCSYTREVRKLGLAVRQLFIIMAERCHWDLVFTKHNCAALERPQPGWTY
ncbi:hypothetical protein CRUP_001288 [Coryphaenoides rupestris]|nr:hypothetical protein CRUP_001288 [Coryphaenoides rupestris]